MNKITVYGAGYVGLVTAACLAELGHQVLCADIDSDKIEGCLSGNLPIYEDGLTPMVSRLLVNKRLAFTTDLLEACAFGDVQFVAVGTPGRPDGSADLTAYWSLLNHISDHLQRDCIVVNKSTVPIGTAQKADALLKRKIQARGLVLQCDVASNPEFLKQGTAVTDFLQADRIVLGVNDSHAKQVMQALYAPLIQAGVPCFVVSVASAELVKYAANAFLATKISFMNELSHVAEAVGADIHEVRDGMCFDQRISPHFMNPGCGYGGSCFPKDVQALVQVANEVGCSARLLAEVHAVNHRQKTILFEKLHAYFKGDLRGKKIALWGLAFKPCTDDLREAPSVYLMEALWEQGAMVSAYDPVAGVKAQQRYADRNDFTLVADPYDVLHGADALCILTEWKTFRQLDMQQVRDCLAQPVVFDGRNMFDPAAMRNIGMTYFSIGRGERLSEYADVSAEIV